MTVKTIGTNLNVDAPTFVPGGGGGGGLAATEVTDESDIISKLPNGYKMLLRQQFMAPNGECVTYYVGRLKSFNNQKGFGFLSCKQSKADWGVDVFIHKNFVPQPWHIGQPVEYAVTLNGRGQPQALDVNWLPRLPEAPKPGAIRVPQGPPAAVGRPATPGGGVVATGSACTGGTGDPAGSAAATTASAHRAPVQKKVERYIGTLKSYSVAQGYGFVACEELFQSHKRDVYLDRSQVPTEGWRLGMCLEFGTTLNQKGNPQARSVVWDPIPLVPGMSGAQGTAPAADQRVFSSATLSKVKKLLGHLNDPNEQREVAVVTAIDFQGVTSAKDSDEADRDIDYVAFVLDRLGDNMADAASCLKDFVKMLLLLICKALIKWFKVLTETINPHGDDVAFHFGAVAQQIHSHVDSALREDLAFADKAVAQMLKDANQMLAQKRSCMSLW